MERQSCSSSSTETCQVYDFPHALCHIEEEEKSSPEALLHHYQKLLESMPQQSYDFLLAREWMMVVPRCRVGIALLSDLGILGRLQYKQFGICGQLFCQK